MKIFKLLSTLLCVFLFQVNVNAQSAETVDSNSSVANLTINSSVVNPSLSNDIEQLAAYNKGYRNSLNAFYITSGISVITTVVGSILQASDGVHASAGVAMFILGGAAGVGSLVSGICVMEYQSKINRQNLKVHLKANGVAMTF